jgi:hypothetical protein
VHLRKAGWQIFHESNDVGAGGITKLEETGCSDKVGKCKKSVSGPKKSGPIRDQEGRYPHSRIRRREKSDLLLGSGRRRRLPALGDLTTSRGKRGITSLETVCIRIPSEHSRYDGSKDDQEGQSNDCESVHGKEDGYAGKRRHLGRTSGAWHSLIKSSAGPGCHALGRTSTSDKPPGSFHLTKLV